MNVKLRNFFSAKLGWKTPKNSVLIPESIEAIPVGAQARLLHLVIGRFRSAQLLDQKALQNCSVLKLDLPAVVGGFRMRAALLAPLIASEKSK